MPLYLGIDTSNYTTSLALYRKEDGQVRSFGQLLKVKPGERGLRQSDALFQHTVNLPVLLGQLEETLDQEGFSRQEIAAVTVSTRPRRVEGSYMPCFLPGVTLAKGMATALGVPCKEFSHQEGHIMAVLSAQDEERQREICSRPFLALHLSGGTTELLLVEKTEQGFTTQIIGGSRDISVGQLIDRVGVMMGLQFPCGREMEQLAREGSYKKPVKAKGQEGFVNLSGWENRFQQLWQQGMSKEDISYAVIKVVVNHIQAMVESAPQTQRGMPLVLTGGVASNGLVQRFFSREESPCPGVTAEGVRCRDNAIGTAVLGSWFE